MKEFLENFASILAAATISMLVLAVCHELGYFWLVGYEFQALLTTTDYLMNAIFWLPFALYFAYTWIDWWKFKDEPPEIQKRWRERDWGEWVWPAMCFIGVSLIIFTMSWPPSLWSIYTIIGVMVFFWSRTWRKYAPTGLPEPFNGVARTLVRLGPPAMFGVFVWGWVSAETDLARTDNAYIYRFKGRAESELRIPLRSFDKGQLVRNPVANRIEFRRWEQIDEVSKPQRERSRSMACFFFDICPKDKRPVSP
jgi:hypothetical protein